MTQPSAVGDRVRPRARRSGPGLAARLLAGLAGLAVTGGMVGCESDSWLFDRSQIGRWEKTPTAVPILTRIASIEGPEDEFLEVTDVTRDDLIPELEDYRVGPGDNLEIILWDIPTEGQATPYARLVDTRGYIELPQLGRIYISGLTVEQVRGRIEQSLADAGILQDPLVDVTVASRRQQLYHVFGGVASTGPYVMPAADYRLLEALTSAGGFIETPPYIYVIRQVPLTPEAAGRPAPPNGDNGAAAPPPGEDLIDVIDELTLPPGEGTPTRREAPTTPDQPPAIDLPGANGGRSPSSPPPATGPDGTWVYLNGEWVLVQRQGAPGADGEPGRTPLFTQRVIRIPTRALVSGNANYNIAIRPGDIIRVPPVPNFNVFLGGQVVRPGAYALGEQLTLLRVIHAAGGLSAIAVPERTDLMRMVGTERQATIRLNLRAIAEQTQPDIFLKANDVIVVGTDFWALPLAVIRNGFRATYGFGFLLDRNFGNDVFGPPPIRDSDDRFFNFF